MAVQLSPGASKEQPAVQLDQPLSTCLNTKERLAWEAALLRKILAGSTEAAGELYEAYADLLYSRILLPKLGQRPAAEDALAETFRAAFRNLARFELRTSSVYFWLATIASNKAMDMHRARAVTGRALVNLEQQMLPLLEQPLTPDAALDGKRQFETLRSRLGECMAALNPRYRKALEMRFFEERSRAECATELDVKLGTFDVLLLRSVKALRKQWEERSPESQDYA